MESNLVLFLMFLMNYFDGSKDCWTRARRQTTCMLFKNHAFHEFLEEQPVPGSQFVGKGRKNTRSWQKRERNSTSGVPPPHYTGLPSTLSRPAQFPLFRPNENLNRQSEMREIIRFCFTKNLTNTFMNSINLFMIWSTHSLSTLFWQKKNSVYNLSH